ncbi:MAG: ribosome small subunit-dependent GTPase A [Planctomycetes bacterium]|nr:ribosome small subunit-dependent GTPase A [Planctomycetota bacterium]MCB9910786.1 ribosome small subunit-dependent GTPase A [Planctomycetota bacterium]MCB9912813.1 ribosome small subunit-dependent GTPase A [Planctomycetota bacterium]
MNFEEKRKQAERALRNGKKSKSLAERKQLAEQSKQRKQQQSARKRPRRDWSQYSEDQDEEPFEAFEKIETYKAKKGPTVQGKHDPLRNHDWLVVAVHLGAVEIRRNDKLRRAHLGGTPLLGGPPVVGDRVAVLELPLGECRLDSIQERQSVLVRQAPSSTHRQKVLAANVDVALISLTPEADGHLRLGIVERIRIALQTGGIAPLVVVTKCDRLDAAQRAACDQDLAQLSERGLEVFATSSVTGEGLLALRERIAGTCAMVVGHSGVGKSTLLNALDPDHERNTGGVREADDRGRHTTTASSMVPMPGGGWLVDTPGIRSFGLGDLSPAELLDQFPELVEHAQACPPACAHQQAGCALQELAEVDPQVRQQLQSYLRLLV